MDQVQFDCTNVCRLSLVAAVGEWPAVTDLTLSLDFDFGALATDAVAPITRRLRSLTYTTMDNCASGYRPAFPDPTRMTKGLVDVISLHPPLSRLSLVGVALGWGDSLERPLECLQLVAATLRHLDVSFTATGSTSFKFLDRLPRLLSLAVRGAALSPEAFVRLERCRQLGHLDLSYCRTTFPPDTKAGGVKSWFPLKSRSIRTLNIVRAQHSGRSVLDQDFLDRLTDAEKKGKAIVVPPGYAVTFPLPKSIKTIICHVKCRAKLERQWPAISWVGVRRQDLTMYDANAMYAADDDT